MSEQIRFCVFVPSFNNARLRYYMRNLDSIFQQDYKNYHVVYVNDASKDNLG
jgi:glycosyltransferase involved in cell wall biosynthesis